MRLIQIRIVNAWDNNWYKNNIGAMYWVTNEPHHSDANQEYYRIDRFRTIKKSHCKVLWPLIGYRGIRRVRKL